MPCGSNHPPKSGDWEINFKAAAINLLDVLGCIPKLMEQYKTENEKLEKDLPTLREVVDGTWKKEDELKHLKSEVAALERKIQLTLAPSEQQGESYNYTNEISSTTISEISNSVLTVESGINDDRKTIKGLRL